MRTYSKLAEPKYARDLPHELQDHINAMSEHSQLFEGMREIFEATIQENTAEDEPDAPLIKVINDVDDEPTPPWEFYYTNLMWHAEGVPPPDIENLQGCDCEGVCGSKSKTCSCLARQREVTGMHDLEWVYDKHGRLNKKTMGYPIYECNERCGCGEECRNRVVQHGRKVEVNIQKTPEKGWGIFAGEKKIPRGTFIGIYAGEIITNSEAHVRGVKYNKFGRTYLFDIDFYHLKTSKDWKSDLTVDAYHAGNFTRFLNHSCDPNCRLYACYTNEGNIKKPLLAIFAIRDIEPKEEICFSYSGDYPGEEDDEEEEGAEPPGPSQQTNDEDDESDDDDDRIWEVCRCGSANCRGMNFISRPFSILNRIPIAGGIFVKR
ncbi:hypothetical protein BJ165DRAFT_1348945 [Panaeolus papilionaceus]|nr:hypothetical protein BJ165DRAFT_1348945 [Panaeolus papilionaceus]